MNIYSRAFFIIVVCLSSGVLKAQESVVVEDSVITTVDTIYAPHHRNRAIWVSWGYNQEWYTKSTVHVQQDGQGNSYDFNQVRGTDHMGWNNKSIFKQPLTIPQYNYRIGMYLNKKQDLGIEINFDHTKYIIADSQYIRVTGTYHHSPVDSSVLFSAKTGSYYFLNNGANFFLVNLVKRIGLYHAASGNFALDFVGKVGVGPVVPHVENSFFGQVNHMGFQIGGWNTGVETVLRATIMRYAFIEISQKGDYARYSNLRVYDGRAKQDFGTYELILSVGVFIPTHGDNPLFARH